jgi:hypothetical protein
MSFIVTFMTFYYSEVYLVILHAIHCHLFVFVQAESNLKQYGKVLMAEAPKETTDLLKRLCTDYKPTNRTYQP